MKKLQIISFLCLIHFWGCKESGKKQVTEPKEADLSVLVDSLKTKENSAEIQKADACTKEGVFGYCQTGLKTITLGEPLFSASLVIDSIAIAKDTLFKEVNDAGVWEWKVKKLTYPEGVIFLESDFDENTYLSRILIECALFKNQHGIGVGSSVREIRQTYALLHASPFPERQVVEISIEGVSNLYFHVPDLEGKFSGERKEPLTIEELNPNSIISRVVIWDPRPGA